MKITDFRLIGHIQVLDESILSLYYNFISDRYFLFIRILTDNDEDKCIILVETKIKDIIDYMNRIITINDIFNNTDNYHLFNLRDNSDKILNKQELQNICKENFIPYTFDKYLAYQSNPLKNILYKKINPQ